MIVYSYHPITKIYVGSEQADPSPLELGKWLIPANSTPKKLIDPRPGYHRIWKGTEWGYRLIEPEPEPVGSEPVVTTTEEQIVSIQTTAKKLLRESDFVFCPDVDITNEQEWIEYRAALRAIVRSPSLDSQFPQRPETQWREDA
jgi:hypothetical protein